MENEQEEQQVESTIIELVDVLKDIKEPLNFPWSYEDNSIKEMTCAGIFEFIPGKLRGKFMDEVYRVLVPTGRIAITVAYWNTARGIQDFRYEYPSVAEQSFLYFNKNWREVNKVNNDHFPYNMDIICDFDFTYGYTPEMETAARNDESRAFYIKRYTNCVDALHLMLTKRPQEQDTTTV